MQSISFFFFFFQAEDGIRDFHVTGVQTCALPIFGKAESWGKRRLAYDLRKQREGTYAVLECMAEPATIKEFERQLRLNEQVLRFMTTRVPVKKRVRGTPKREPAAVEESA